MVENISPGITILKFLLNLEVEYNSKQAKAHTVAIKKFTRKGSRSLKNITINTRRPPISPETVRVITIFTSRTFFFVLNSLPKSSEAPL